MNSVLQQCNVIIAVSVSTQSRDPARGTPAQVALNYKYFLPLGDLGMEADTVDGESKEASSLQAELCSELLSSISGTSFCSLSDCSHTFHSLQPLQKRRVLQGVNKEMNRFTNPSINHNTPLGEKAFILKLGNNTACVILIVFHRYCFLILFYKLKVCGKLVLTRSTSTTSPAPLLVRCLYVTY